MKMKGKEYVEKLQSAFEDKVAQRREMEIK